jgi:hypothetical protein
MQQSLFWGYCVSVYWYVNGDPPARFRALDVAGASLGGVRLAGLSHTVQP